MDDMDLNQTGRRVEHFYLFVIQYNIVFQSIDLINFI